MTLKLSALLLVIFLCLVASPVFAQCQCSSGGPCECGPDCKCKPVEVAQLFGRRGSFLSGSSCANGNCSNVQQFSVPVQQFAPVNTAGRTGYYPTVMCGTANSSGDRDTLTVYGGATYTLVGAPHIPYGVCCVTGVVNPDDMTITHISRVDPVNQQQDEMAFVGSTINGQEAYHQQYSAAAPQQIYYYAQPQVFSSYGISGGGGRVGLFQRIRERRQGRLGGGCR